MAKAKKSTSSKGKKPAKSADKPAEAAQTTGAKATAPQRPLVDTDLAASNAARLLAAKAKLQGSAEPQAAEGGRESAAFKQMKGNLNKPSSSGLNTALGSTFGNTRSNLPGPTGGKQVGHHQTQSGFNARTNVPRRTNG